MTTILFDNLPQTLNPTILDWNIYLYSKEQKQLAVFQFCKITKSNNINEFYLERGKILELEYYEKIRNTKDEDSYFVYLITPDFIRKLCNAKLKTGAYAIMPGGRFMVSQLTGTYENLVDL